MNAALMAAAFAGVFLVGNATAPKDDPNKIDLDKLQGTWTVESGVLDGNPIEQFKGLKLIFSGATVTLVGQEERPLTVKLNAEKTPREIDVVKGTDNGAKAEPALVGIYKLDGDKFKVTLASEKRPKKFHEKNDTMLLTFKREKK